MKKKENKGTGSHGIGNRTVIGIICIVAALLICFGVAPVVNRISDGKVSIVRVVRQVDAGAVATWALPQGLLVVNADLCTGCQRCEINCTLTNDGVCSSYISRVKIQRRLNLDGDGNGLLSGTDNCFVYFPDTCRQCEDPACGNACPQKAITTDDRGIRVVDTDKCIGCGACHDACPWHMPTVNPETGKSSKCIACGACVAGCPSGALSIVDWDAVTSAAQAAYMDL